MNIIKFVLVSSFILLAIGLVGEKLAYGIYEDQLEVCNFEKKCLTIDIDDFMSKQKSDLLWALLNNDIDTYSVEDMVKGPGN